MRIALAIPVLLLLGGVAGLLFAASGFYNVAASEGHWAVTRAVLAFTMRRSVVTHALGIVAPRLDEEHVQLGLAHYAGACTPCHGAPGEARNPVALGAVPEPPLLERVSARWEPGQLFWIVKHGLKYTSMPAWPAQERDDEVWAVVAGLLRLRTLEPTEYRRLVRGEDLARLERAAEDARLLATAGPIGEDLVACARCHGVGGRGRGPFPRLAGQPEAYLLDSLRSYALGVRASGVMQPIAAELDDSELRELAAYFAALPPGGAARAAGDPRGRAIAESGVPEARVPACAGCHTEAPHAAFPELRGQPLFYLVQQLRLFRDGVRDGTPQARVMGAAVRGLRDHDLDAVARHYAGPTP